MYSYSLLGMHTDKIYIGLAAFVANLVVSLVLSAVFHVAGARNHGTITDADFGTTGTAARPVAPPPTPLTAPQ